MAKIGLITIISMVLNLFLTFWLVNQYLSDVYFQSYVNGTIGQYYPFIVLTFGVGGGSGLGYLFLKRKHGDNGLIGKIQKSKSFKPSGPLTSTASTSASKQSLPTGAPPSPVSKHTVYAVPPLPKSSSPSSSRSTSGSTWASAGTTKSSLESILSPKQDTISKTSIPSVQAPRSEPPRPSSSPFSSVTEVQPPQPLRSIGESPTRQSPSWAGQQPSIGERRPESGPIFQKSGLDVGAKPDQQFTGFSGPSQTSQASQTSPVPSKWAPPEDRPVTSQWPEGGVKSIPPLPTKWTPPTGQTNPQERPPPPSGFPRPGPAPVPSRGPLPTPPGGPRPFVVQGPGGPGRPGEQRPMGPPRPVAAPQQFRPDPNRPPPGMGAQPRPQNAPRPAAPLAGPMPQPWTPPSQSPERKDYSNLGTGNPQSGPTSTESSQTRQGSEQKSAPEGTGGGGEMDWDTALDTILKTLRKDRVGDTK
jgi:hypothetical protein